jgi:hypothetical protein
MTPVEQRRRFEETARELGCDDGQALDAAFGKIVPPKVPASARSSTAGKVLPKDND